MLRWILTRAIDAMERRYGYDASYMREVLAVSPWTFLKFGWVASLGHGKRAPVEAITAAALVGTLAEDCGPCTQISVDLGLEAGAPAGVIRAVLAGDEAAMGDAAALAWRFARASLARDMRLCDPLRDEVVRRWGRGGLVDIAMALTTSRMYPTLKYAMGHGKTCSKVLVAGEPAPFAREAPLAA